MRVLLGTDPEFFVESPNPQVLIAKNLFPDARGALPAYFAMGLEDPKDCRRTLPHGVLMPDGLALEFTVDPDNNPAIMVERMRQNIIATRDIVAQFQGTLSVCPRIYVDQRYIDALPVKYGKACSLQLLGCDPDICAYGWELPKKPDPKTHNFRTSGGHVHFGLGTEFVSDNALVAHFIALCDATLGAATTVLCDSPEALARKEQYGQPGMYRTDHKRGTVEYRTMPAQAFQTPELAYMIFSKAAELGDWASDLFNRQGQQATVAAISERIGGLGRAFELAEYIRDHNAKGCLELMDRTLMADVLAYNMPEGFALHGWY